MLRLKSTSYYYSQIDLEDLHADHASAGIILDMQDRDRYYNGQSLANVNGVDAEVTCPLLFYLENRTDLLADTPNESRNSRYQSSSDGMVVSSE